MTISTLSLSLLPASDSGATSSILGALYGNTSAAGSGNPVVALQTALKTETKGVATAANDPQTKREVAAFRAALASAKTPEDLLSNPDARKVLLTANGLGDQTAFAALAKKALLSDTSKPDSLASKLTDARWLTVAKTYDFANQGLKALQNPSVINSLINGYAEVQWRTGLDKQTPGLSNAIDFRTRANTITSALQILGDSTLRKVVLTALGIPQQIAFQSLEAQEKAITNRVDLEQFKKPAFVDQFTKRYLIAAGATASTTSTTTAGVSSLFA